MQDVSRQFAGTHDPAMVHYPGVSYLLACCLCKVTKHSDMRELPCRKPEIKKEVEYTTLL